MWSVVVHVNGVRLIVGSLLPSGVHRDECLRRKRFSGVFLDCITIESLSRMPERIVHETLAEADNIASDYEALYDVYDQASQDCSNLRPDDLYRKTISVVEKYESLRNGAYLEFCSEIRRIAADRLNKQKKPKVKADLQNRNGYVYILKNDRYYKIGKSRSPNERFESLQTASPHKIERVQLYKINAYSHHERQLHEIFRTSNVLGEWFELIQEDLNLIHQYMLTNGAEVVV